MTGEIDDKTLEALKSAAGGQEAFTNYAITGDDTDGPFMENPADSWKEMAKRERLSYTSAEELLAEKFHVSQDYLKEMNSGKSFTAGTAIKVPNVEPFSAPAPGADGDVSGPKNAERVEISETDKSLRVLGEGGKVLFYGPITPGSPQTPLPDGSLKINGLAKSPKNSYDPEVIKDGDLKEKASIPPGPNNPVGVMWIDLSKDGYGIHGTPEPDKIGYSESHGCVRLTNWDAMKVAGLVKYGLTVDFK